MGNCTRPEIILYLVPGNSIFPKPILLCNNPAHRAQPLPANFRYRIQPPHIILRNTAFQ